MSNANELAILRLSVRLGQFCLELHYGAFLVQYRSLFWLLSSCAKIWARLRLPKKKTKKGRTHYISLIKSPFNGLTIILTTMKFLTDNFSIDL